MRALKWVCVALLMVSLIGGRGIAAPASVDASTLQVRDPDVRVTWGQARSNRRTGTTSLTATVTNMIGTPIQGRMYVAIPSVSPGSAAAAIDYSYVSTTGMPLYVLPTVSLDPGVSTSVDITFSTPTFARFTPSTDVLVVVDGRSGVIGPAGGVIAITDPGTDLAGVQLSVPPGALSEPTLITAIRINDPSQFEAAVSFGPNGTVFAQPVQITLPYYSDLLHQADVGLGMAWTSGHDGGVLPVTAHDPVLGTATCEATHFTDFVFWAKVGIKVGIAVDRTIEVPTYRMDSQPEFLSSSVHVSEYSEVELTTTGVGEVRTIGREDPERPFWSSPDNLIVIHGIFSDVLAFQGPGDLVETLSPYFDNVRLFQYRSGNPIEESANYLYDLIKQNAQPGFGVTLVAHSEGGLVARYALERTHLDRSSGRLAEVKKLITVGTPHLGAGFWIESIPASLRVRPAIVQMTPPSNWLNVLNAAFAVPSGTDYLFLAGGADGVVGVASAMGAPTLMSQFPAGSNAYLLTSPNEDEAERLYDHGPLHTEAGNNGVSRRILTWLGFEEETEPSFFQVHDDTGSQLWGSTLGAYAPQIAQRYVPGVDYRLTSVEHRVKQAFGSPNDTIQLRIYSGGSTPAGGTLVAAPISIDGNSLQNQNSAADYVVFDLPSPLELLNDTTYWFVFRRTAPSANSYFSSIRTAGSEYAHSDGWAFDPTGPGWIRIGSSGGASWSLQLRGRAIPKPL